MEASIENPSEDQTDYYSNRGRGGYRNSYGGRGNYNHYQNSNRSRRSYGERDYENFGNAENSRGQKRSRDDGNSSHIEGELTTKRFSPWQAENNGQKKRMPGGMVEHQEDILPQNAAMVKEIVTRLGDFTVMTPEDDVLTNIMAAAAAFASVENIGDDIDSISNIFVKAFSTLSVQIPIIGTLVGVIARDSVNLSSAILTKLDAEFINSLAKGDVPSARLQLRSFAVLVSSGALDSESLVELLKSLASCIPMNSESLPEYALVSMYLIASTLPWAVESLIKSNDANFIKNIQNLFEKFLQTYVSPFDVSGSKKTLFYSYYELPEPEVENPDNKYSHVLSVGPEGACCWDSLIESMSIAMDFINQSLSSNVAYPLCMSAYWSEIPADSLPPRSTTPVLLSKSIVQDAALNIVNITKQSMYQSNWLSPRFYLFELSTLAESLSGVVGCFNLSPIEKHVLSSYYVDILHFFDPVMRVDGTMAGTVDTLCNHVLALGRCATRDYTPSSTVGKFVGGTAESLHLEYLICDTYLQLLSTVPAQTKRSIATSRVLLELYKKVGSEFASALCLGALLLYQMLPSMDFVAVQEYAKWLSLHMTNTNLAWPYWDHWVSELQAEVTSSSELTTTIDDENHETPTLLGFESTNGLFCRIIIDKLSRVFVPDVVRKSLPPALQSLVPSTEDSLSVIVNYASVSAASGNKITNADSNVVSTLESVGNQIYRLISERQENDVVEAFLDEGNSVLDAVPELVSWPASMLLQSVLSVGGQVLSVLVAITEKYSLALRSFGAYPVCQRAMIRTFEEMHGHNLGVLHIILDILLRRGILQTSAFASYVSFPSENSSQLTSGTVVSSSQPNNPLQGSLRRLDSQLHVFSIVETLCDRAIDFVKASLAARLEFGNDIELDDKNLPVVPAKTLTDASSSNITSDRKASEMDEEEDDDEGNDDGRRDRQIDIVNNEDAMEDPKDQATEGLRTAISNCRETYKNLLIGLLEDIIPAEKERNGDRRLPHGVTKLSMLRRILRTFHESESIINEGSVSCKVVLTDVDSVNECISRLGCSFDDVQTIPSLATIEAFLR